MTARPRGQRWRALVSFAIVFAVGLRASLAHAVPASIVVFGPDGALSRRIHAELTALGFRSVAVQAQAPPTAADAEAAARAADASAGAYVLLTRSGVEVWLLDSGAKPALRHVLRADASEADADRFAAVRLAELLRASLLELERADGAEGEPATREPIAAAHLPLASREGPRDGPAFRERPPAHIAASSFSIDGGLGATSSIGAVGVTPLLAVGAAWHPTAAVGVGVSALVPLGRAEVSAREGRASVETWQLALGPRVRVLTGSSIQPVMGAGVGLLWFQVEGTGAALQYTLTSDQLLVPAAHVEVGVRFRLSRRFALSSGLCSSLALAKPVVEFADRQVLTLGRPLVAGTLRIEYGAVVASHGD